MPPERRVTQQTARNGDPRIRQTWIAGMLAMSLSAGALASPPDDESASVSTDSGEIPIVHILMNPVQRELEGPDAFDRPGTFGFGELAFLSGVLGATVAGFAIDGAIDYSRDQGRPQEIAAATRPLGGDFDFRKAVHDGIAQLDRDTNLTITEIHEQKIGDAKKRTSRLIMETTDADFVICLEPTYFIAPGLDQLRLIVRIRFFSELNRTDNVTGPYDRTYEYLSPSRGELFRPYRDGEKAALIAATTRYFDEKTAQYPQNRKAYGKDRKRAVKALEDSETILPAMAIGEGWPGDSIEVELQTATDRVMSLVHADLLDPFSPLPKDVTSVTFAGLDLKGRPRDFEGNIIGAQDSNTVYRDEDGNVYSVPLQ